MSINRSLYKIAKEGVVQTLEAKDKEIERLNNKVEELMTLYTTERNVKEDYKIIIKEVRELANTLDDNEDYIGQFIRQDILEILDKEK